MIYTIGYQRITVDYLARLMLAIEAKLIDCRFAPVSRIRGWGGRQLADAFGDRYEQRGHELGGRGHTTAAGIDWLKRSSRQRPLLLMCMEEAPGDCHRHFDICGPHFPDAVHIFREELFTARALETAFAAGPDADYELCGSVAALLRR